MRERESTPYGVVVVRICRLKIAAGQAEDQPPDDRGYPTLAQSLSALRGTRDCVIMSAKTLWCLDNQELGSGQHLRQ